MGELTADIEFLEEILEKIDSLSLRDQDEGTQMLRDKIAELNNPKEGTVKHYICNDCGESEPCRLSQPDAYIIPEYCPNNDGENEWASWKIDTEHQEDQK